MSAPLALQGVGMGLQAYGTIQAQKNQVAAAGQDAYFKELQAEQVLHSGAREQRLLGIRRDKTLGAQRAAFGASGFDISGSALLALEDTAAQAADEAHAIRLDSQFRADQLRRSGAAEVDIAKQRQRAALIALAGSILVQSGNAYQSESRKADDVSTNDGTAGYTAPIRSSTPLGFQAGYGLPPPDFGIIGGYR